MLSRLSTANTTCDCHRDSVYLTFTMLELARSKKNKTKQAYLLHVQVHGC